MTGENTNAESTDVVESALPDFRYIWFDPIVSSQPPKRSELRVKCKSLPHSKFGHFRCNQNCYNSFTQLQMETTNRQANRGQKAIPFLQQSSPQINAMDNYVDRCNEI